jgi:hypothetical protein
LYIKNKIYHEKINFIIFNAFFGLSIKGQSILYFINSLRPEEYIWKNIFIALLLTIFLTILLNIVIIKKKEKMVRIMYIITLFFLAFLGISSTFMPLFLGVVFVLVIALFFVSSAYSHELNKIYIKVMSLFYTLMLSITNYVYFFKL